MVENNQPEETDTMKTKTWTNLFQRNRAVENSMSLAYIPLQLIYGQVVVQLDKVEVDLETEKWKNAVIAYIIGKTPGYNAMKRFVGINWANVVEPELYLHEEGYYNIKFQNVDDMKEINYFGPYTFNNRPIILKPWTPDFDFNEEFPTEIPLWVQFPNLPMNCWGHGLLSRMASTIGTPIYADECTAKKTRVSFARMLIEVNITKDLLVRYDWKPEFCQKCLVVGHKCGMKQQQNKQQEKQQGRRREPKKVTREWRCKRPLKGGDSHANQPEDKN
ncbi:uncharacterized protein LOC107817621 [Nicotiana tabacum]|uniref:Uncharacterized protein LOC107817621 n=1 Tax=Nicotiana tabacum TaxID=4097 RepID=A0A1S4CCV2_TOBAC|nr:PREDICTED: uncharacterized protein LOC107817621 [Nicotiana tabacum]